MSIQVESSQGANSKVAGAKVEHLICSCLVRFPAPSAQGRTQEQHGALTVCINSTEHMQQSYLHPCLADVRAVLSCLIVMHPIARHLRHFLCSVVSGNIEGKESQKRNKVTLVPWTHPPP
jgi:hypothetical protein